MSKETPLRTHCTSCRVVFEIPQKSGYCGPCSSRRSAEWRAAHPKAEKPSRNPEHLRTHCSGCGVTFKEPQRSAYCSPCGVQRTKEWGEKNPEKLAALRARFRLRTNCSVCHQGMPPRAGTRCSACDSAYRKGRRVEARAISTKNSARYREKHRETYMKTLMAWRAANPGRVAAAKQRNYSKRKGALGGHTHEEWLQALVLADFKCVYCGQKRKLTRDHVIPLTRGGSNEISNIVPACGPCNSSKYNRTAEEFAEAAGNTHPVTHYET